MFPLPGGVSLGLTPFAAEGHRRFATGHAAIDAAFGGGLGVGRLHEAYGGEAGAVTGFVAMLALCAGDAARPLLWVRTDAAERAGGRFDAGGFVALGGDPRTLFMARARDDAEALRVAADATRCAALGVVVLELWGAARDYDLTASRRLVLAAASSGVTLLLGRVAADPVPSAAETRWAVRAAPSHPLEADAPGHPRLDLDLLRRRAGRAGLAWRAEWRCDARGFADARDAAVAGGVQSDRHAAA